MAMKMISVTDIEGFRLGNAENREKGTGCTVIVCEEGAVGGVDVRGGGPATRETDLLRSENTVNAVNAVVLSGGSAFGLEAASGVMRELAEMKIGFDVGDDIVVPIVCGASLYDLPIGDHKAFPDIYMGAQAVRNAFAGAFATGNHGAGTGATVGKLKGYDRAMKSGLGTFACGDGVIEVGAIAAVNAVGDIYNGAGNIIAGLRSEDGKTIYGTIKTLKAMVHNEVRHVDDSTSFVDRTDIEKALAAAAKQYEEEKAARLNAAKAPEVPEEALNEEPAEIPAEEAAAEFTEEPVEELVAEPAAEEEIPEEDEFPEEEPCEEPHEEPSEEDFPEEETPAEESFEEPVEEPYEEFIPETPSISDSYGNLREYAEISIPIITAEPEAAEIFEESAAEEEIPAEDEFPEEEPFEEPHEEPVEEDFPEEEPYKEPFEEPAEDEFPEEETFEEPHEEPAEEDFPEEEPYKEPFEEPAEEEFPEDEFPEEEPFEEHHEEPAEEEFPEDEFPEEEPSAEEPYEEPAEEDFPEEEPYKEPFEEPVAEEFPEEEPVALTREEMGYDIVFNTTISCLITNAELTKSQANKLASILHDAYARAIKPVHGTLDGDTVFVLATGKQKVNFDAFAALATDIMQYAIIDGAMSAESAYGLPAARDMQKTGE